MTAFVVIGIDPGASTGLAILEGGRRLAVMQANAHVVLAFLDQVLSAWVGDPGVNVAVAYERFTTPPKGSPKTQQSSALQVIGSVMQTADKLGYRAVAQAPGDAKRLAPNELLRCLGLYVTPREVDQPDADDANDAVRHALLYLARHRASEFDALLTRTRCA